MQISELDLTKSDLHVEHDVKEEHEVHPVMQGVHVPELTKNPELHCVQVDEDEHVWHSFKTEEHDEHDPEFRY